MVDTCFLGSSTETNKSWVSPSRSSSSCRRFKREDEDPGLDVPTGVPFGRLRSCEKPTGSVGFQNSAISVSPEQQEKKVLMM